MIDKREILETASSLGLQPSIVEKDYVLGWLLAGINAHPELSDAWVFKGGTCLKKCYFETYRFSEDLNFTLRDETSLGMRLAPIPARRVPTGSRRSKVRQLRTRRSARAI